MTSWTKRALGEVATVGAGNSAPQDEALFANGSVPFFRTSDVGRVRFGDIDTATDLLNVHGAKGLRRFPSGTILFPKSGASTFLNHRVMMQVDGSVSSHLATIAARRELAEPRYLLYFLATVQAQDLVQDHAYPSLNLPLIAGIEVPLPSLPEQRRIVAILDEAFEGIATAKANAEKNLQNARELFGRLSAAVLNQLAPISRTTTLEEVAESGCSLSYGIVQPGDEVAGGLPIVRPVDLNDGVVMLDGLKRIDPALAKSYERTTLKGNDILLCVRGTTGALAMADSELAGANVTRGIVPIRFDEAQISQDFGYCLMRSEPVQMQIQAKTYGTALMQINIRDLRQLTLPVPPKQEQDMAVKRFIELKAATDQLVETYQRKLTALDELKKSLLHQAFSGQL